jgi:hypothetical protein
MSKDNENKKPIEVIFAPGCFDSFDGTQEELDEMIQQIKKMAESGELFEKSTLVELDDIQDIIDETNPLEIEQIVNEMLTPRKLQ